MKTLKALAIVGLFLAMVTGCSSTRDKESMLSAAGFQMISADSPQRLQHLRSLPPDKITKVERNGMAYYTFPDPSRNVLYVGGEPQFQQYQQLRFQQQETMQQELNVARYDQDETWWGIWGPWGEPGWAMR